VISRLIGCHLQESQPADHFTRHCWPRGQSKGDPGESDAAGAAQGAPKIINHVRRLLGRSRCQPSNRSAENAGLAQGNFTRPCQAVCRERHCGSISKWNHEQAKRVCADRRDRTIAYGFTSDGREARVAGAGPVLGYCGSHERRRPDGFGLGRGS